MSLNRVIGKGNQIPWHLPEDFRWFKQTTSGHVLIMGRKTYESIGKPLPNRKTIVLSRSNLTIPGVAVAHSLEEIDPGTDSRDYFICGGAEIYAQALARCSDLYLTLVKRTVEGDAFFPPFEEQFELVATVMDMPEFSVLHYRKRD